MSSTIPPIRTLGPIPGRTCLRGRLYPNGEFAVWKEKTYVPSRLKRYVETDPLTLAFAYLTMDAAPEIVLKAIAGPLGSSPLPNSDRLQGAASATAEGESRVVKLYGSKGITSYGARRTRNACHLLQKTFGKHRCVFATVTIPSMPSEDIRVLQRNWNKVVETYRRKLKRHLEEMKCPNEMITVSEIQTKRYERTGIPVLHLHTVFVGKTRQGQWAISTQLHDKIWAETLTIVIRGPIPPVGSACNLQRVKKSCEGYLGKYMTKGGKVVRELLKDGFQGWLPKQWWAISKSLGRRIDNATRDIGEFAEWISDICDGEQSSVVLWHRDVRIEMKSGDKITIARYGRLSKKQTEEIQAYY